MKIEVDTNELVCARGNLRAAMTWLELALGESAAVRILRCETARLKRIMEEGMSDRQASSERDKEDG